MKTVVTGFFALKTGDTYLVLDSINREIGKLDVCDGFVSVTIDNDEVHLNEQEIQPWFEKNGYILSKDSPRWIEYNPNPSKNTKASDCTIRAYCAAENMNWDDAYDLACSFGKSLAFMPNDSSVVKNIVQEELGYEHCKLPKAERGCTVSEFAIKHSVGTYLVEVASHLVAVIDGEYYDSWDSGKKKVRGYYTKGVIND